MACGIPIVATNFCGIRELVKDGENGYLVNVDIENDPKLDKKQLIYLLVKVLQDGRLNSELKRKTRKIAMDYDFHKVIPMLIKLLKKKKYIKAQNEDKWALLKNKKIIDFKDYYKSEIIMFIYFFGLLHKAYSDIYNEIENTDRKMPIFKIRSIKNKYIKDINQEVIGRNLFRYMCLAFHQ